MRVQLEHGLWYEGWLEAYRKVEGVWMAYVQCTKSLGTYIGWFEEGARPLVATHVLTCEREVAPVASDVVDPAAAVDVVVVSVNGPDTITSSLTVGDVTAGSWPKNVSTIATGEHVVAARSEESIGAGLPVELIKISGAVKLVAPASADYCPPLKSVGASATEDLNAEELQGHYRGLRQSG